MVNHSHTKKFYISSMNGDSGISQYSRDFFKLILEPEGYIFVDSSQTLPAVLSQVSSIDEAYLEIGIFQKKEIEILLAMLRANYKNVSVTLHDAPLLKYPFHEFRSPLINGLSKLCDIYGNSFGKAKKYVKKIKSIYVLSRKGVEIVKRKYGIENVYYLPHVIDQRQIEKSTPNNMNLIYFGFIGKNKGIEYALKLHQHLVKDYPSIYFYVVGSALGKEKIFYEYLKRKYHHNVIYLGYVPDEQLDEVFSQAAFALILFKDYRFFCPASGSLLYSLKKGKIVFTNNVNAVGEIIEDGKNGFYLSGNFKKDIKRMSRVMQDKKKLENMKEEIYDYLLKNHSEPQVRTKFKM